MLINYVDTQFTVRLKDKISTETRERLSYISCALPVSDREGWRHCPAYQSSGKTELEI